ncbi:MAG: dihydrolipoyl dehydrogenase [Candidatus Latescibacteria bacterium]|nr:dihydrolipoyl dehydrogenase [Candidatus Latescibacterota bacterium]
MQDTDKTYDIVVVGGGPGGYTAAIRARQLGLSTALVEEEKLGGVCLNWGCIPTKALLKQAELYRAIQNADEFGFEVGSVSYNWDKVIGRSRDVAQRLAGGVEYLMGKNGVEVVPGRGRITPARQVEVQPGPGDSFRLMAKHIILATGSRPRSLPGIELDGEKIITSKEAMSNRCRPDSLIVVGAGAIGVEFAYFYNAFGTRVKVLEALPQVLPREDEEVAGLLAESLKAQGIEVETGVRVEAVEKAAGQVTVRYKGEAGHQQETVDQVLMAVGVEGRIDGLGLEAAGVRTRRGFVDVDERLATNVKGIYAIGDMVGAPQLAHVAAAEGVAAVEFIAGHQRAPIDRGLIPQCIYCQPQVASLGLNEAAAREAGHDVKVGRFPFQASGKAQATGDTEGLVKLVFDARYGELLGASIIGSEATELIAEIGLARKLEATYEELLDTMHAHPTLSEAVMEAAGAAFGQALNI